MSNARGLSRGGGGWALLELTDTLQCEWGPHELHHLPLPPIFLFLAISRTRERTLGLARHFAG